jgi:hypothetical protein
MSGNKTTGSINKGANLSISPYIYYTIFLATFTFGLFLIGLPASLITIGYSSLYAQIVVYNIAFSLSYFMAFGFNIPNKYQSDVIKRKLALIYLLSPMIMSSLLMYKMMLIFNFITISSGAMTIGVLLLSLLMNFIICRVGKNFYHHESIYIPVLLTVILPVVSFLPGFLNYNVIIYLSFILSCYALKMIRQPFLKIIDSDLRIIQRAYDAYKNKNDNDYEFYYENIIENKLADIKNKDGISQLIKDKFVMHKITEKYDKDQIKKYFYSSVVKRGDKIENDFASFSENFKSWINTEKFRGKLTKYGNDNFYNYVTNFDLGSIRSYYLEQNSSQNSIEVISTMTLLLLATSLSIYLPEVISFSNYLIMISGISTVMLLANLTVLYFSHTYFSYSGPKTYIEKDESESECKSLFGVYYEYQSSNKEEIGSNICINIYFAIICIMSFCFIFQYNLMSLYLLRADYFIDWQIFCPQMLMAGLAVLYSLSTNPAGYEVNLSTRLIFFGAVLYSGILMNIFCPQLLVLFTKNPSITNYIVMTSFTYLLTQLVTVLGHDGEDSRTIYNVALGRGSPIREVLKNQRNMNSLSSFDTTCQKNKDFQWF